MRTASSITALALGLSLMGGAAALAQTAEGEAAAQTEAPADAPAADAPAAEGTAPAPAAGGAGAAAAASGGAGAAAAASGGAAAAPAATAEGEAPAEEEVEVVEEDGKITLPNGMDLTPDYEEYGRWYNADGIPVPKIEEDGTVDYATFSGYRRYHAECHVCHGPDGEGSTYAPALKNSVLKIDYYQYQETIASGKQSVGGGSAQQVMPAFGTNKNVWCYVDDIYVYLLAHGTDMIPRGRPQKKAEKSDAFAEQEDSCMSM